MALADPAATTDATRDRLLDAAATVFAEKGYDRAGVQEIARRAGLTTGAIYGRFTGKADLLQAAIESRTTDELDELFAQRRFEGHASDILRTVGSHLVTNDCPDADHAEGALLLEAFVAARRDPEVRSQLGRLIEDRASVLAELVEEAKLDGSIDQDLDTKSLVIFCHAVGLGFLLYDAIDMSLPHAEPWEQLINRLVGAVAPPDPTHKGD
jgi:TetR/AcrR family transcriptional repressor of uid operon